MSNVSLVFVGSVRHAEGVILQLNVYIQFDTCIRPLKSDIRLELFV